jgi:hypothetical protein
VRWSKAEEQLLEQLVGQYGVGCWSLIRDAGGDGFATIRTAVSRRSTCVCSVKVDCFVCALSLSVQAVTVVRVFQAAVVCLYGMVDVMCLCRACGVMAAGLRQFKSISAC